MSLGDYVILGDTATVDIKAPLVEYVGDNLSNFVLTKRITRFVRILTYNLQSFYQSLTTQNADLDLMVPDGNGGSVSVSYGGGWTLIDASASHIETGIFSEVRLQYQKEVNYVFEFGLPTGLTVSVVSGIGYIKYNAHILESFNAGRGGEWRIQNNVTSVVLFPDSAAISDASNIFGTKVFTSGYYTNERNNGLTIIIEGNTIQYANFDSSSWIDREQRKKLLYGFNLLCCEYLVTQVKQTANDTVTTQDIEFDFQYVKSIKLANCLVGGTTANWTIADNDSNYEVLQASSEFDEDDRVQNEVQAKFDLLSWIVDVESIEIISRVDDEIVDRDFRKQWSSPGGERFQWANVYKHVLAKARIKARISYYDPDKVFSNEQYFVVNGNELAKGIKYEWSREGNTIYLKANDLILRQYDVAGLDT